MRKLKIAAAQLGPLHRADPRSVAVSRLVELMRQAHGMGAKFVVFPELAFTTFFPRWWMENQEEVDARFFEKSIPSKETQPLFDEGKKLGIVGYGNIGSQLSVLAEAMGMEVHYYDVVEKLPLGNATKCASLKDLLKRADVVSVHVDGNPHNRGLFGEREFSAMRAGAIFLNLSRGFVVDVDALARNLRSGRIRGAAVDVFPDEPRSNRDPFSSPFQGIPNVILTPHIGGSTEEAQEGIGAFVAGRILEYLSTGGTGTSVNFPVLQPSATPQLHRYAHLHENIPGMLAKINDLFARHGVNISGQRLETRGTLGYALIDVAAECETGIVEELRRIPHTIRARRVY